MVDEASFNLSLEKLEKSSFPKIIPEFFDRTFKDFSLESDDRNSGCLPKYLVKQTTFSSSIWSMLHMFFLPFSIIFIKAAHQSRMDSSASLYSVRDNPLMIKQSSLRVGEESVCDRCTKVFSSTRYNCNKYFWFRNTIRYIKPE